VIRKHFVIAYLGGINFIICTLRQVNYKVEDDEVGGTCGTNRGEEEHVYVTGRKPRRKETTRKTET
jgi:hypothetical protein